MGISPMTVCNWEVGRTEPEIRYLPAIHRFIGFCPVDPGWTFGERLRAAREARGWSVTVAGAFLRIDPGTIRDAESERRRASRRPTETLRRFLSDLPEHSGCRSLRAPAPRRGSRR